MTGRKTIVGLSLLCALVFCALAVPNAMALKGTTAFTCKEEPSPAENTKGFSDEHCTKEATGLNVKFIHSEIIPNMTTQLEVKNDETSKLVPTKLLFTAGGVEVELEAGVFESCMGHTAVRNQENAEKQMEAFIPEICGEFSKVEVKKPGEGCVVPEGKIMLLNINKEPPERGKGKSVVVNNGGKEEMYVQLEPFKEKPFATFTIEKCKNAFINKTYKIEGTARANVTTELNKLDGPTLRFTTEQTAKTLKVISTELKTEGRLQGTFTARMLLNGTEPNEPVVLTTT